MGTGFVKRNQRVAIGFDEIQVGDKIRVTYTTGQKRVASSFGVNGDLNSTVSTRVGVAAVKMLDRVWLCADGHTLAHRDWQELEIDKISDEPIDPVRKAHRQPWSAEDDRVLRMWDISDARAAKRLGRTTSAVVSRRHTLRKAESGLTFG